MATLGSVPGVQEVRDIYSVAQSKGMLIGKITVFYTLVGLFMGGMVEKVGIFIGDKIGGGSKMKKVLRIVLQLAVMGLAAIAVKVLASKHVEGSAESFGQALGASMLVNALLLPQKNLVDELNSLY